MSRWRRRIVAAACDSSVRGASTVCAARRAGHESIGLSMQLYDQPTAAATSASAAAARSTISTTRGASPRGSASPTTSSISSGSSATRRRRTSSSEYAAGRTPIPCVHCNGDLKFATLVARAEGFGAELVATGHYARVEMDDATGTLPPEARARRREGPVVLPVHADAGAARARDVSRSALSTRPRCASRRASSGLPVADKPDSHEICFVADGDHAAFVERHGGGGGAGGDIRDAAGPGRRHARRACTASPSASARGSASPRRCRSTSSASMPRSETRDSRPARRARAHAR